MSGLQSKAAASWPELWTLLPRALRSKAGWISSGPRSRQTLLLEGLSERTLVALPWLWDFWALEHQRPPPGDWRTWVILGGRGAGKTRAGAEWVRSMVEGALPGSAGQARRVALVGETLDQAREVMVMGDSGILSCCPPDRRPTWIATRRILVWPNGAEAQCFSAHDPEALRGPQFDAAWVDELAKWRKTEDTWDMLQFALRLGAHPRVCVTTTPRNNAVLKALLTRESTVTTHAPTEANAAHLAASYLREMRARYTGRLGRQELDGEFLADVEGALWPMEVLEAAHRAEVPELTRIVVAVDPAASGGASADEGGIVVAGAVTEGPPDRWRAWVLADETLQARTPVEWARAAVAAYQRHGASRIVAEVNQGGDMVGTIVAQVDPLVPFKALRAVRGKVARAEPVAALYEQGRVFHAAAMPQLEDQMALMATDGFKGRGSPDRVDALVWALTELMIDPARDFRPPGDPPRVRMI